MGAKHPLLKEAESVEYFSQLSATNEDCLIFYWRQILKYDFRTPGEAYIHNGLSWLIKVLRKGSFHNGPVMCPLSVIIALEVCIVPRRCLGPLITDLDTKQDHYENTHLLILLV